MKHPRIHPGLSLLQRFEPLHRAVEDRVRTRGCACVVFVVADTDVLRRPLLDFVTAPAAADPAPGEEEGDELPESEEEAVERLQLLVARMAALRVEGFGAAVARVSARGWAGRTQDVDRLPRFMAGATLIECVEDVEWNDEGKKRVAHAARRMPEYGFSFSLLASVAPSLRRDCGAERRRRHGRALLCSPAVPSVLPRRPGQAGV